MSPHDFLHALIRWQFGLSAGFHFLFVPLSLALLLCVNILQTHASISRRTASEKAALVKFLHTAAVGQVFKAKGLDPVVAK